MVSPASPAEERLLIIASSARALAASAVRAGYRPDVIDLFADADTRELAGEYHNITGDSSGLDPDVLLHCLAGYHARHGPVAILPGTGFESRPWLLTRLADYGHVFGNDCETVRQVKNPSLFNSALQRLGLPTPSVSLLPAVSGNWLCKPEGGCGGVGIRAWKPGDELPTGYYLQQQASGRPASVVFLADGKQAWVVGYNLCETVSESDMRFAAAVSYRPSSPLAGQLESAVTAVVQEFGLRGLCGLDVLMDAGEFHILEINPRPPASFELHEGRESLIAAHLAACKGSLQPWPAMITTGVGKRVVYAEQDCMIPAEFHWPEWCADRPCLPAVISAGEPVCTVFAHGASPAVLGTRLKVREQAFLAAVQQAPGLISNDKPTTMKEEWYEQDIPRDKYELAQR